MRGKLRDKRAYSKRDSFKRDENEQRRPYKRDSRTGIWDNQPLEDDDAYDGTEDDLMEDAEDVEIEVGLTNKK
ncbi:MAG: hypothetical protein NVS2B12_10260 [Ktedonobacteraceae bacterium]